MQRQDYLITVVYQHGLPNIPELEKSLKNFFKLHARGNVINVQVNPNVVPKKQEVVFGPGACGTEDDFN